jgi:hypothetical protein
VCSGVSKVGNNELLQEYNSICFTAVLEVASENFVIEAPSGDYLLDGVERSDLFFGGMPPSVNMDKYMEASG